MGWFHPDIHMEDLIGWIKGFVDILVLASGYQSSGLLANWDANNIKKSVNWGLFFEDVLKSLRRSGNYGESVNELDAALSNLTSDLIFPRGLAHLSSATLSNARRLVLEHLLQINPIKEEHVDALLRAVVELDIDELSELHVDSSKAYTDMLTSGMESPNIAPTGRGLIKEDETLLVANYPSVSDFLKNSDGNLHAQPNSDVECKECVNANHSSFVIQEILNRQSQMSCMYTIEKGLDDLVKIIAQSNLIGTENLQLERQSAEGASLSGDQMLFDLYQFNHWRSRCLSYLLDKRTIKLLSGADLILKAPKEQWIRVFEGLSNSTDACCDDLLEIMEILLLGLISSKWDDLIRQLMSLPCDYLSFSKRFSDLHELLEVKSPALQSNKENDILEYVTPLLSCQPQKLWKLPSILVAASIPSWSILFRIHLCEIENQYNKTSSSNRWHGWKTQGNENQDLAMACGAVLGLLYLLSLSSTNAVLAAGESSSGWSNILQLVGKPWSRNINGEQEELEMVREPSLKNYCESWRLNVELHNIRSFYAVPDECTSFVSKYMSSSQYKSDIHRATDEISLFLANSFSLGGDGLDAWVFDIDDTLISTLPFHKNYHFGDDSANWTLLEEWMAKGKAPAIDKMPDLFHDIRGKGLSIFLISWRPEHLRSATVDNLIKAGYHGWTQLILRCDEEGSAGVQKYRTEQRKKLVNRGYRLWGNVGAQWSSLNGHPTAKRGFKLPNPMYYL